MPVSIFSIQWFSKTTENSIIKTRFLNTRSCRNNTGSDRITCKNGYDVISYVKIRKEYRIQYFHFRLSFRESRVWKFIEYIWTWLIPQWTGLNNRQKIILCVKISRKCRIRFFHQTLRFREKKFENLSYACTRLILN